MSFASRAQIQSSEVIQDSMPVSANFDNEGDELSATEVGSNQTIGKLVRWVMGLSRVLGETGRRKGFGKFHGDDTSITGTITSSGVSVTGSGSAFLTELAIGDFIAGTANEFREVTAIASDTALTLAEAFTVDIASGQAAKRVTTLAERLGNTIDSGVGSVIQSIRSSIPGFLLCNGALVSRTTYASLFAVSPSQTATITVTIATPGVVTWTAHGLATGHTIQFSTTSALPTGITSGTVYYIRKIDANTFHLYDTLANAMNTGVTTGRVNTSGSQSGVHTGLSYLFGNGDGSTTFGVPDFRGAVPRGVGVSSGYVQSATIVLGEKTDDAFQGHHHEFYQDSTNIYQSGANRPGQDSGEKSIATSDGSGIVRAAKTDGTNGTPRTTSETRVKSLGLNFFIKY